MATIVEFRAALTGAITSRLGMRRRSVYARLGEAGRREHVEAVLDALEQDLESGRADAVRAAMRAHIERLSSEGLTFSDLRSFCQTLREALHEVTELPAGVEHDDAALHEHASLLAALENWLFELVLVATMHLIAQREAALQERSVRLEMHRLESQLAELEAALNEKTQLLEIIRQASTPIAPVVRGILVVPLVGMFDAFRAEALTERLLLEITRTRTRVAILDISGVPLFDTNAAQLVIRLARTVRLLGAQVYLVGMSPENARTIVDLGIDLTDLRTLATLQDGLALALGTMNLAIVSR